MIYFVIIKKSPARDSKSKENRMKSSKHDKTKPKSSTKGSSKGHRSRYLWIRYAKV